ncbi:unnamed protein product [Symbiodinium natans]|uniref:Uncharacterized protein n=1 Tax=Symbiodinium natans TaxID=878477 RepID=A0A812JIF6_9DINO|nr:unnamed protein product [Symbiodinium natans]
MDLSTAATDAGENRLRKISSQKELELKSSKQSELALLPELAWAFESMVLMNIAWQTGRRVHEDIGANHKSSFLSTVAGTQVFVSTSFVLVNAAELTSGRIWSPTASFRRPSSGCVGATGHVPFNRTDPFQYLTPVLRLPLAARSWDNTYFHLEITKDDMSQIQHITASDMDAKKAAKNDCYVKQHEAEKAASTNVRSDAHSVRSAEMLTIHRCCFDSCGTSTHHSDLFASLRLRIFVAKLQNGQKCNTVGRASTQKEPFAEEDEVRRRREVEAELKQEFSLCEARGGDSSFTRVEIEAFHRTCEVARRHILKAFPAEALVDFQGRKSFTSAGPSESFDLVALFGLVGLMPDMLPNTMNFPALRGGAAQRRWQMSLVTMTCSSWNVNRVFGVEAVPMLGVRCEAKATCQALRFDIRKWGLCLTGQQGGNDSGKALSSKFGCKTLQATERNPQRERRSQDFASGCRPEIAFASRWALDVESLDMVRFLSFSACSHLHGTLRSLGVVKNLFAMPSRCFCASQHQAVRIDQPDILTIVAERQWLVLKLSRECGTCTACDANRMSSASAEAACWKVEVARPACLGKEKLVGWGMPDTSENDAADQAHSQIPWWKLEQETLARRSSERGSERKAPAEHRDQKDPLLGGAGEAFDRTLQKRPQSWRMGRPEKLESPARPEPHLLIAEDLKHDDIGRGFGEPWRIKAKELQAIAAAHRSNAKRREAESLGRQPEGYPAEEGEVPKHPSGDHFRELHRREELRFEEMKQEELRRLEREREENRKRRQEQEEWEQAMRRKFAEEAEQLKAARRVQKEVEEQEEKKFKEGAQRRQAMKQEEAREREEAKKRRQEQDEWEQAMRRKIAVEAEQLNAAQRSKQRTQDQHNQDVRRSQGEKEKKQSEASQHQRFGSEAKARVGTPRSADPSPPRHPRPSQSPQGHRSGRLKSVSTSTRNLQASGLAELQAAKSAAMRQLIILRQHPSKEARQKGFKDLLRMWHPDKNPGSPEVATAVFQMIQAERGRVFK